MVTFSRISNNLDLYDLDCQMSPGSRCMLTRFYVEFLELHIILLQQFPVNSKGDDKVLPYLPGLALSNGRSEALDSYLNQLLALPPNISQSTSIRQFFTPGVEHPLQSPGGTHRFSFDGMQEEELDKLRTTISTAEQSPETNTLSRSEHLPDQGSTIDICEPLDAQMNTKSASVKNNDHQLQRNFRDSLCETLVAGFPRFNINLAPKIAKTLAIWLIHVYALNIGKRTEAAINIILEQLNTVSSNDSELTDWLSQSIHKHLELQLPDASLSRLCNNCGKSETLYWTDHNHPSRQRVRKNARICITCVVSIYLLDVTNNVNHGKFSSWIILEILRLGSKTIKAYYHQPEYKITDEELGGAHQRMIILYGLNLLHITNPLWPSSKGEARVSSWIWSIIQKNPDSYIMTTQEKVLFEQYEPRFILEHDVGIIKAAYSRYEEAESSRILALTSVPQSPAQLKVPIISAISFLFTIIDVKPDYDAPDHQIWEKGWLPPDTREAIKPSVTERPLGNIYRWTDGIVRKCDDLDNNKHRLSTSLDDRLTFSTYTVMMDKSNAFACVPFDARRVEVRTSDVREWQYLGFDHITSSAGPTGRGILSKVVGPGHFPRLAGYKEDRSSWIRDFFPGNYQSVKPRSDDKTPVTHLGLVGNLALVIALAAFTAPAHKFDETIYNNFYSGRRWASTREIFHARM